MPHGCVAFGTQKGKIFHEKGGYKQEEKDNNPKWWKNKRTIFEVIISLLMVYFAWENNSISKEEKETKIQRDLYKSELESKEQELKEQKQTYNELLDSIQSIPKDTIFLKD